MKILKYNIISLLTFFCLVSYGQINLNQISPSITPDGSTANVYFNTQANFVNTGQSTNIRIFFRMPSAQTSPTTTVSINSSLGTFTQTFNGANGADRIMIYQLIFPAGFDLSQWLPNQSYLIGDFTFSNYTGGPLNLEMFSAGQNMSTWNGTSMTRLDGSGNADNLVQWPVTVFALLPINLSSFDVTKNSDKSSKLDWTTSSEINSDYFGIERSQDGNNWENIGKVLAAGNSSDTRVYSFIDDQLPLNRNNVNLFYYRLKMTDIDGQYKYSDIRGINFRHSFSGFVTIYPNPTTDRINVDLSGLDLLDGKVDLSVYDMNGGRLINKNIIGNGIELIDVNNLPAATYNVVVKQGTNIYQQRIIKID